MVLLKTIYNPNRGYALVIKTAWLLGNNVVFCFPDVSYGKESTCSVGDPGSIPGLGRLPGKRNGYPLQYSCLENPHGQRKEPGGLKSIESQRVGHD